MASIDAFGADLPDDVSETMVKKESEMNGKRYRSVLQWVALPQASNWNPISWMVRENVRTTNSMEIVVHKLFFKEMSWRHTSRILRSKDFANTTVAFDKIGRDTRSYCCITRGIPVNLKASAPVMKLRYKIGGETYALVKIYLKPVTAPKGKKHELLFNSDGMGFEHRLILPIIKQALTFSIDKGCCTCLRWDIKDLDEAKRRGKDETDVEGIARLPLEQKVTVMTFFDNFFSKLLAEERLKAASELVSTRIATELALIGAKILAHKSGTRKRIYGAEVIVGGFLGAVRAWNGDVSGAAMEVSSGIISCFPGFGEAVSIAIDLLLYTRSVHKTAFQQCGIQSSSLSS